MLVAFGAAADPSEPPLLLGGPAAKAPHVVENDPHLPTGAPIDQHPRPPATLRFCSEREPVCVHAAGAVAPEALLTALSGFEHAYRVLVRGLELPAPLSDEAGGGPELDLYLSPPDRETPGFERVHVFPDARRPSFFDRSSAFCTALADDPVLLARAATLCVGEAIALRLDAGETPDFRRAFATELWWATGLPTSFDFEALERVQARPSRAIAARDLDASSEGRALFLEYLEQALGTGAPGELSAALVATSAQETPPDAPAWHNEPDWFDVVRHTTGNAEAKMAHLLGDFAVTRAFLGEREDGAHLPSLAWSGHFGAARPDWILPFETLPRRVRLTPLEPTGSALVWLDLGKAPQGFTLGMRAEWEPPAEFQWLLVTVGARGELSRFEVPFQERETVAEARIGNIHDARAVIAIGTHLERVDADHPFDPDVVPFEPHGASLYLVEL
ncbi:MAG TPA: hypothetical protein VGQ57_09210 [Polyangiaceae bacterium]|jgi:hypothetical protein|nr:hypothetical protein [Polyangiaceae bacterium]